jgi:hypothetical protein
MSIDNTIIICANFVVLHYMEVIFFFTSFCLFKFSMVVEQ